MEKNVITLELAREEFGKWAEAKRIPDTALEKHQDDTDAIVEAFQKGNLELDDDLNLIQKLIFPLKNGELSQLKFRLRATKGELSASTKGVRVDNALGEMPICYISCLTGQNKGEIRALDSVDSALADHIAAFFLI